jgi:tetratricopeptide (TPR) repeat protein
LHDVENGCAGRQVDTCLRVSLKDFWTYEWSPDLPASQQRAIDLAQKSVDLDPSLPYGHQQLAYLYVYKKEHDRAIAEAQEAVRLGGPS